MERWLCLGSMGVAGLMLLAFLLDLILGVPFGGAAFLIVDIVGLIAAVLLAYMSFNAFRDLR
jgi:hypothetical protein